MGPDWGVQHIRGWKRNSAGRGEGGQADCQRPWKDREGGRGGDGSRLTSGKQRCAKQPWLTQADGMREGRGGGGVRERARDITTVWVWSLRGATAKLEQASPTGVRAKGGNTTGKGERRGTVLYGLAVVLVGGTQWRGSDKPPRAAESREDRQERHRRTGTSRMGRGGEAAGRGPVASGGAAGRPGRPSPRRDQE